MRIEPFRGYRYRPAAIPDLSAVVAPPYDQIGPELQARLHAASPWGFVRLTLPREPPAAARRTLEAWLAAGIVERDERPAIYPYQTEYALGDTTVTRQGFIALGALAEYAEKVVLPHERTRAAPKAERLTLLEATGADTGLLFMLVEDPAGALREAARPEGRPVAEAHDLRGDRHRLWRLSDPATIGRVQELMSNRSAIIADGHHRYETALAYRRRHPEVRHKLMAFFALDRPGVTILPTHRLVRGLPEFALERLLGDAADWFEASPPANPISVEPDAIVVVAGREAVGAALRLRPEANERIPWPAGTSAAWRRLAVSVLHEGLLKPFLGITDESLDRGTHVEYTADAGEAVARVRAGAGQVAFLIPATTAEELRAVVAAGELLPPKSTFFYPKLLDGLVFHLPDRA